MNIFWHALKYTLRKYITYIDNVDINICIMNFFIIIWQETINFVSEKNLYVRVVAGINVLTREAHWEFQSLDPLTGSWLFTSQKDLQLASDDKHDHDLCQNENFTCISRKEETTNGTVKFHKNAINVG